MYNPADYWTPMSLPIAQAVFVGVLAAFGVRGFIRGLLDAMRDD